jgi:hypothetical protein
MTKPVFVLSSEAEFNEMFEVLPPLGWNAGELRRGFLVGEPWSHRMCAVTDVYRATYQAFVVQSTTTMGKRYLKSAEGITLPEWRELNTNDLVVSAS